MCENQFDDIDSPETAQNWHELTVTAKEILNHPVSIAQLQKQISAMGLGKRQPPFHTTDPADNRLIFKKVG